MKWILCEFSLLPTEGRPRQSNLSTLKKRKRRLARVRKIVPEKTDTNGIGPTRSELVLILPMITLQRLHPPATTTTRPPKEEKVGIRSDHDPGSTGTQEPPYRKIQTRPRMSCVGDALNGKRRSAEGRTKSYKKSLGKLISRDTKINIIQV
jgi:hypothetical protein